MNQTNHESSPDLAPLLDLWLFRGLLCLDGPVKRYFFVLLGSIQKTAICWVCRDFRRVRWLRVPSGVTVGDTTWAYPVWVVKTGRRKEDILHILRLYFASPGLLCSRRCAFCFCFHNCGTILYAQLVFLQSSDSALEGWFYTSPLGCLFWWGDAQRGTLRDPVLVSTNLRCAGLTVGLVVL